MDVLNQTMESELGMQAQIPKPVITFSPGVKLDDIERLVILETLRHNSYNRTHAAKVLGIGIRTLQRKLKRYGVSGIGLKKAYLSA